MSDAPAAAAPAKAPKAKKPAAPKKPAEHPKYAAMINAAVAALKERGGSSRQAILKYIIANYKVGDKLPLTLLRKGKRIHFDWPLTDRD